MALKMSAACLVEGKLQTHRELSTPNVTLPEVPGLCHHCAVFWTFVNDKFGCLEKMHAILAKVYHN